MDKSILASILVIALTGVALQVDNALALSSVASGLPASSGSPGLVPATVAA